MSALVPSDGFRFVELPLEHFFAEGVYVRELRIPKGAMCFGRVQLLSTVLIFAQGSMVFYSESGSEVVKAPRVFCAPKGAQRVGFALEDCLFFSAHPNPKDSTDVRSLEDGLFMEDEASWAHFVERKLLV